MKRSLFFALFHSILSYGIEIWGTCGKTQMDKIQIIQNRAIKNLYALSARTGTIDLHNQYQILLVRKPFVLKASSMAHGIINHTIHTQQRLSTNSDNHSYNTRTANQLFFEKLDPTSIKFKMIQLFNTVPNEIKSLPQSSFKTKLKKHLNSIQLLN